MKFYSLLGFSKSKIIVTGELQSDIDLKVSELNSHESTLCNEQSKKANSSSKNANQDDKEEKLVLCQDCGAVLDYSDDRHNEKEKCVCGGSFCGCDFCNETIEPIEVNPAKGPFKSFGITQLYFHQFILKTSTAEGQR